MRVIWKLYLSLHWKINQKSNNQIIQKVRKKTSQFLNFRTQKCKVPHAHVKILDDVKWYKFYIHDYRVKTSQSPYVKSLFCTFYRPIFFSWSGIQPTVMPPYFLLSPNSIFLGWYTLVPLPHVKNQKPLFL